VAVLTLSTARVHGSGLEFKHNKAGVSASAPEHPEMSLHSLPATLRMLGLKRCKDLQIQVPASLLSAPWIFKGRRRRPKDASESEALCRPSNLISGRADSEVVRARPRLPPHKPLHKTQRPFKALQVAPKNLEKARILLQNKQSDGKLRTRGRQGEERTLLGASDNVSKVPRVTAWR
jgi:hypothetical protein